MSEIVDVAPGLWLWRTSHPDWSEDVDWSPAVTSVCVESRGEVVVLDALAPTDDAVWQRLDATPPTAAIVLKPDHVRDVDLFVERYGLTAYGPWLYFPHDVPKTRLERFEPGMEGPGGLLALYDGRWRMETPVWLPEHKVIVFADALTERDGELIVWASLAHESRALPALRALLELPFERVIISHGEPVHDRAAFERALELPPFSQPE